MFCIDYVCKRVLIKVKRCSNVYFDREQYIQYIYYYQRRVPEVSDIFFGLIDGLITAYDGEHYFCCCSNCIIEIRTKYSIQNEFSDDKHDACLDEINTYFNEIIEKEIRVECIFLTWKLCRDCLLKYFYTIKGELMTLFHLNVCEC